MKEIKENYRGHAILTNISGPIHNTAPYKASYTIWKVHPNNHFRGILDGILVQTFDDKETAHHEAMQEAKQKLDIVLDK